MYTSLKAASRTVSQFLLGRFTADPVLGPLFQPGGSMQVSLLSPEQMVEATLQGLSVWMYRVERDEETLNAPDVRAAAGLVLPPPLPMRAHYLVTPITDNRTPAGTELEQVILGKVLQALYDRSTLRGADLADDFLGTDAALHVRLETLSLQDLYDIWDALQGSYRLSVSYEVGVLNIDPAVPPTPVVPVSGVMPEYVQVLSEQ
jgi:hypothetical protein